MTGPQGFLAMMHCMCSGGLGHKREHRCTAGAWFKCRRAGLGAKIVSSK